MTDKVRKGKLSDLTPDRRNANKGTKRGLGALDHSLRQYGAGRSILVDKNGNIIAGNKTAERAADIGLDDVIIVQTDGKQIVAVQRTDLDLETDPAARELAIADNRVGQLDLEWEPAELQIELEQGINLSPFFTDEELEKMGVKVKEPVEDAGAQIDKAEELREHWGVELGQMWQLGEHRIICGDCTDRAVVDRLMGGEKAGAVVTDPPYGINREGIENDDPKGLADLFDGCLSIVPADDAVVIAFQSPRLFHVWFDACRNHLFKFERLLWMHRKAGKAFPWRGWVLVGDPIQISSIGTPKWGDPQFHEFDCYIKENLEERSLDGMHSTIKPLDVVLDLVSHTIGVVYEPFSGSGTTIIACERLGRKCRAVEIAPAYVAVAIQRWVDTTGGTPVLLDVQ